MAIPIADSEAAIVKIKNENNCPYKSSRYTEKTTKFKFIPSNINSIHIKIIRILVRLKTIPDIPTKNKKLLTISCLINIKKQVNNNNNTTLVLTN